MASGSSSRTDTSWPSASMDLAIADPPRPDPTMSTNIRASLYKGSWLGRDPFADARSVSWRGRENHLAGSLFDHVARGLADEAVTRAPTAPEHGATLDPRRLLRGQHDRLDP